MRVRDKISVGSLDREHPRRMIRRVQETTMCHMSQTAEQWKGRSLYNDFIQTTAAGDELRFCGSEH